MTDAMIDPSDPCGDDLPSNAVKPPQNEEGRKDELHPHNTRTSPMYRLGTAKKNKTTNVEDTQEHQSQVPIHPSLTQTPSTQMTITNQSEIDMLKRRCLDQRDLLVAQKNARHSSLTPSTTCHGK